MLRSPLATRMPRTNAAPPPAPHTGAELAALVDLLTEQRPGVETVTVGHGRDAASTAASEEFTRLWEATGRHVLAIVGWPEEAASWLRPARRFAAGEPDAWVVAGPPAGWAQMSRRLRHSTGWSPERTFGFASTGGPEVLDLAGPGTLEGMRGAWTDGGSWRMDRHVVVHYPNEQESSR